MTEMAPELILWSQMAPNLFIWTEMAPLLDTSILSASLTKNK
jgi:hypothetical protein